MDAAHAAWEPAHAASPTRTVNRTMTTATRVGPRATSGAAVTAYTIQEPFGIDALTRAERPTPEPGPGQVLVRMRAVALNYRDLLIVNRVWKAPGPRLPVSDGVGEVVAAGTGVTRVAVGDRVAGTFYPHWLEGEIAPEKLRAPLGGVAADGVLAGHVLFAEDAVVRVPAHLSDEEAATLP